MLTDTGTPRLRVLFTAQALEESSGGALYVRDFMTELSRRGHLPVVFSTRLGALAQQLQRRTLAVIDRLDQLAVKPDIIHGSVPIETMAALLTFPDVPAIFTCHGWDSPDATPPKLSRIMRYLAVDEPCHERLVCLEAIPTEQVVVHFNPVDLERFLPRSPLPDRPRKALIFSNYATEQNHVPVVREACHRTGVQLDVVGFASGTEILRPDLILGNYDIVFAKGRSALEALAVGTAVILCHVAGSGPMVTSAELDDLRRSGFGWRAVGNPMDSESIVTEIQRYDAVDAARVSARIRESSSLVDSTTTLVNLYQAAIDRFRATYQSDPDGERRDCAAFLQHMAPFSNTFYLNDQVRRLQALAGTMGMPPTTEPERHHVRMLDAAGPSQLQAGESTYVTIVLKNDSRWCLSSYGPSPVKASYHWLDDQTGDVTLFEGVRTEIFPPLPSGKSHHYRLLVRAPPSPGSYRLRLTLVQETIAWFDAGTSPCFIELPIRVT